MLHRRHCPAILALIVSFLIGTGCTGCSDKQPSDPQPAKSSSSSYFEDQSEAIGLDFKHRLDVTGKFPIYEITGAGMAVFDANNDGRLDLLCMDSGARDAGVVDRLFLRAADGKLKAAGPEAGFSPSYSTGCTVGDIDNDGDIDVFAGSVGVDRIYLNDGKGRFRDASAEMGFVDNGFTTSAAFIDYNLDGFLDLFVCRYTSLEGKQPVCSGTLGTQDYCHPKNYTKITSQLWKNIDGKRFVDVSKESGIGSKASYGLGVVVEDFNEDGWLDLYIANDGVPNFMWINQKNGTFKEMGLMTGTAVNGQGASESSMGLAVTDIDRNGYPDIFTTNLMMESNTLYLGEKGLRFSDGTSKCGLSVASLPYTGWGTAFFDAENDGDEDLMIVNGAVARNAQPRNGSRKGSLWEFYAEGNLFFENRGDGRLDLAHDKAKDACDHVANHRSMLAVDFDGDGGVDVFVNAISEETKFYRNTAPSEGNWVKIEVLDEKLNRHAMGAVVRAYAGDKVYRATVNSATSYQAASLAPIHFGIGESTKVDRIEVDFPGGDKQTFPGGNHGQTIVLRRQRK